MLFKHTKLVVKINFPTKYTFLHDFLFYLIFEINK